MRDITNLALRARGGERSAIDEFVMVTLPDIRRFCASLVDPASADDLTQQTYLKAIEALPRYRGEAPASAWLLSIARHTCIDEIRRRRRAREVETIGLFVDPPVCRDHAERVTIESAIADLDTDRREAFVLTQLIGLSYDEASTVIGCPIGTVRSRVFRARESLVEALRERPAVSQPRA
ncbi:MAG TPA: sigma-70 family RNA polymerase sigma factor [Mycobacteriales bacterium]|nr:sigma-70 family RNA polymerase sigma factor [Mycobacteriales bacterium]